jgi:glyoxylase-like metal-dependent hydrolase (beta-lactamase superfamily II)
LRVETFNVGPLDNNNYVLVDESTGEAALVDPSFESRPAWDAIQRAGWKITWLLNTHAHIDHVVENAFFAEQTGAPLALHDADLPLLHAMEAQARWMGVPAPAVIQPAYSFTDGEEIAIGGERIRVAHTPGHSPGSVSLIGDGFVLGGDVLFAGSIGRTDLPGGNLDTLIDTIRTRLYALPDDTRVYPGHGPATTIGHERRTNPFVKQES